MSSTTAAGDERASPPSTEDETGGMEANPIEPPFTSAMPEGDAGEVERKAGLTPSPVERPFTSFTQRQKIFIVTVAATSATFTGFASNIYFPAIPTMAQALHTTQENINLTVTSYMVFQGISPTFWGAASDVFGRRLTLMCTFVVFFSACVGLALTTEYYQLVILRCMQSTGSACTVAIGAGIIGDVTTKQERGGYIGIFQTGSLAPLAIGPVLGGVFAQTLGWRAIFWFLVIYSGLFILTLTLFFPETLRSIVGDGSIPPYRLARAPFERLVATRDWVFSATTLAPQRAARVDFLGPIRILFAPQVFFVIMFLSIHYTPWQMGLTAQSSLFASIYGLTELQIGLTFLANGLGCMLGALTTGKILDRDYHRLKRRALENGTHISTESLRLRTLWFWSPFMWFSVLLFGWSLDKHLHIAAPIVASFTLAWSAIAIQTIVTTFLVDIYPTRSASANAALNLSRCLIGAAGTGSVDPTISKIGIGPTFTLWAGIMVLALSFVGVQMKWGEGWRLKKQTDDDKDDD